MTNAGTAPQMTIAKPLSALEVAIYQIFFAAILDLRPKTAFIARHIPGAFHIDLEHPIRTQIEKVGSGNTPLVLLMTNAAQYDMVVTQLLETSYQNITGYLSEGLAGWEAIGLPLTGGDVENIQPKDFQRLLALPDNQRPILIDVREPREFAEGFAPTARLFPMGDLVPRLTELDVNHPVAVICGSGSRSQAAAALLGLKGFSKVYDVLGGMRRWEDQGLPIEGKGNTHAANSF